MRTCLLICALVYLAAFVLFAQEEYRDCVYVEIRETGGGGIADSNIYQSVSGIEATSTVHFVQVWKDNSQTFGASPWIVDAHNHQHGPPGSTRPCRLIPIFSSDNATATNTAALHELFKD